MAEGKRAPLHWEGRIFALTWLSYFSYYFTRKNWSVVKKTVAERAGLDKDDLKLIDTLYLGMYAVGQFVNGFLGDRFGARKLVGAGMLLSATLAFIFAAGDALALYAIAFGLNGFAQSTGWPGNNRVMASWFSTQRRGAIMGFWCTCYQAGGLAATIAATFMLAKWGWRAAYVGNALWVLVVGMGFILLVRDKPSDVGFADVDVDEDTRTELASVRRAAWRAVLRNPMVWLLGINYACMKLTRYALLFWLPFYFAEALDYSAAKAGYMSTSFEIGGIVGVIVAGLLADKVFGRRRVAVAIGMTALLAASLALYARVGSSSMIVNFTTMMLVGACLFGPDSLVAGAVAQDVGGPHAAALACGVVNGIGSIGGLMSSIVVVAVNKTYGWDGLFLLFQFLAVIAAVCLLPFFAHRPADSKTEPEIPTAKAV